MSSDSNIPVPVTPDSSFQIARRPATVQKAKVTGRARTSQPKSRFGCGTCKKRRVKCDERKPTCLRCEQVPVECSGYLTIRKFKPGLPKLPYFSGEERRMLGTFSPVLLKNPNVYDFEDDDQRRNFQSFHEQRTFPSSLSMTHVRSWSEFVLQVSHEEPTIRLAIAAVGAMTTTRMVAVKDLKSTWEKSLNGPSEFMLLPDHVFKQMASQRDYAYGLQQYGRALNGMRGIHSLRTALLASLLTSGFENAVGRGDLALAQARGGCKLVAQHLTAQYQNRLKGKSTESSLDQPLLNFFINLNAYLLTYTGKPPNPENDPLIFAANQTFYPISFRTIQQAGDSLDQIMERVVHLNGTMQYSGKPSITWQTIEKIMSDPTTIYRTSDSHQPWAITLPQITPTQMYEFLQCTLQHTAWARAFQPLLKAHSIYGPVTGLQLTYKYLVTLLTSIMFISQMQYDRLLPEFMELTELCAAMPWHDDIVKILFFVATSCRDQTLRRRAIGLLRNVSIKEDFNSKVAADAASWLVKVEEGGLVNGEVNVSRMRRVRLSEVKPDFETKTADLTCIYSDIRDEAGNMTVRQTTITW